MKPHQVVKFPNKDFLFTATAGNSATKVNCVLLLRMTIHSTLPELFIFGMVLGDLKEREN